MKFNNFLKPILLLAAVALCRPSMARPKAHEPNKVATGNTPPLVIQTTSLPAGKVGVPYNPNHEHFVVTGGDNKYLIGVQVKSGQLPEGLRLDADTSHGNYPYVAGMPLQTGVCVLQVKAIDQSGHKAYQEFQLIIGSPNKILFASNVVPAGTVGTHYKSKINVTGGVGEYCWSIVKGELPNGIDIDDDGEFVGTPCDSGHHEVVVRVEDESGQAQTQNVDFFVNDANNLEKNIDYEFRPYEEYPEDMSQALGATLIAAAPRKRINFKHGYVLAQTENNGRWVPGRVVVPKNIVEKILTNMLGTEYPHGFRPELGKNGGASFITTEGDPYVGKVEEELEPITLQVEVWRPNNVTVVNTMDLENIEAQIQANPQMQTLAKAQFETKLKRPMQDGDRTAFKNFKKGFFPSKTWDRIGEMANDDPLKVIEVDIDKTVPEEVNGKTIRFNKWSKRGYPTGKFMAIAEAAQIKITGGISGLLTIAEQHGIVTRFYKDGRLAKPETIAAESKAEELRNLEASRAMLRAGAMRAGRGSIRELFIINRGRRTSGMINNGAALGMAFLIWQLTNDAIDIYYAKDHVDALVTKVGGWAGATAAFTVFSMIWATVDIAGPVAWVLHGIGGLIAGGIGWYVGSNVTHYVYSVVITHDSGPIHTSNGNRVGT